MTLKVKTTGTSDRTAPNGALHPGDIIEVGSSHVVKIDGDENWISYKVSTKIADGETAEQAHARTLKFQIQKVQEAVKATVDNIRKMSEAQL